MTDKLLDEKLMAFINKLDGYRQRMVKGNVLEAKTECPKCGGMLVLSIQGTKKHLWAACRDCTFRMME